MKKDMILHTIAKRLVCNGRMRVRQGAHCSSLTGVLRTMLLLLMLTLGIGTAWGEDEPVVEITSDDDLNNGTEKLYLIAMCSFNNFYMSTNGNNVNTSNIPSNATLWYFKDAGTENENGVDVQYYYIVSKSSSKYINNSDYYSTKGRTVTLANYDSSKDDQFRFKIVENTTSGTNGFYNINIKPNGSEWIGLNKRGGNISTDNVRLTNDDSNHYINDGNSKWKFIKFSHSEPIVWTPPFTLSNNDSKSYYRIINRSTTANNVSYNTSTLKATVSTVKDENSIWYFEEATSYKTDFITYYYIVNNSTGKYLYYNSSASKVELRDKVDNDNNYLFIITQAAFDSPQSYDIYPKTFEENSINANNCIGNNSTGDLQIINGRTQNGARWKFEEVQQVAKPVIQYDATQNAIIITCATAGATIYYTTAADEASLADPTPSTGTACNSGDLLQEGVSNKYIKAIAVKDGCVTSEVSNMFSPVMLRCATPVIVKSGDNVTISCGFPAGASIFYTTNGDPPTSSSNPYSIAIPVSTGNIIKAIAIASGYNNSEVATLSPSAYTYHIVDTQGHIAIKCTVNQYEGTPLTSYTDIPEAIRSPYLEGETLTFYSAFTEGSRDNLSGEITSTPEGGGDIYVSYTIAQLEHKPLHLKGSRPFKMQVNGQYLWDNKHGLQKTASDGGDANTYLWKVAGNDPYRVQIQNVYNTGDYFTWSTTPSPSLTLEASPSYFIILGGSVTRPDDVPEGFNDQVELMAATGADISSNTYYNVGCTSDVNLLASDTYGHGNAAIQVLLKAVERTITFHIIDMSGRIVVEQSGNFDRLEVPERWKSPLVKDNGYHYYKHEKFRVVNGVYTLKSGASEITDILEAPTDIYVTYDPKDENDEGFKDLDGSENRATDGKKYLLKFAGGTSFRQEKSDGFEATADEGIYPYINGEGGLFVYGDNKLKAQANAVASTRTRWAWYLEGGDPYRLRISSLQTRTDGNPDEMLPRYSYLRTYMPKGYDKVVTGVISNNPIVYDASDDAHAVRHKPTDYMILKGTGTHFRLVTTDVVDDLDGDATNDVRHTVTSFENYWKTNPTAANVIHDNDNTFTVGTTPTDAQITAALTTGAGAKGWHSYNVWAYGSTWTSSSKSFPASFSYGPHWFQTIDVGTESGGVYNGDFDLEEYHLDGALILLDQHGWEVMRKPITNLSSKKAAYATELRKYDSPMVKKYHFWTNFRKDDGYHKYKPIRDQSDSKKNAQHKGVGTSLADYPEVPSGGTLSDIYVTYEVMATYRDGYKPKAENPNERVSKYLIRQGTNYAKTTDGTNITLESEANVPDVSAASSELLWYVKPNINIDAEMGYHYSGDGVAKYGEKSQTDTESDYYTNTTEEAVYDKTNGQNGFDPYNLQIESAANSGKLFTTTATGAGLDGSGGLESTYSGAKTVGLQSYTTAFNITNYYDSGTGYQIPHVTNSTFMAVSDDNGNIRLMPRFDHNNVVTSLTTLDVQLDPAPYGDESGTQTTLFVLPSTPTPSGEPLTISSSDEITDMNGYYILDENGFDITKVIGTAAKPFRGTIDGQLVTIDGVSRPLVAYADGATIKNVIVKTASINGGNAAGNAGAICCQATGATRIYNCGILPTTTVRDKEGNITGFTGSHVTGSANVGGIVGLLDGNARVINCFSYATIISGSTVAGIVGNIGYEANASITQDDVDNKPMVVNCMFYGDITGGTNIAPVYGGATGAMIKNDAAKGVNPYCYFRGDASFNTETNFSEISKYRRSWPADEEYLTRFEYYRSILNSNRQLCTYWVTDKDVSTQTSADIALIAKWVLDPEIAPYPVLKKWGKYPSVINPDPTRTWDPDANNGAGGWQARSSAEPYRGKSFGTLSVTIDPGDNAATGVTSKTIPLTITDMDRSNHDYGYYKVQLPYYNEQFGDPDADPDTQWDKRYGGNYKSHVVTGWMVTSITGGVNGVTNQAGTDANGVAFDHTFTEDWESGYNFADRYCTNKDLYSVSGRVFAQGGFFYVPEGVTAITIEAKWGKAVYLHNTGHYIDRVNITASSGDRTVGSPFESAGQLPTSFQGQTVYDAWHTAVSNLDAATLSNGNLNKTVYDQAVVLLSNFQLRNENGNVSLIDNKWYPYTIMSIDLDMDNEPDYCFEFQFRGNFNRYGIQPIRFDFLPVPELGLAVRHNEQQNTIGIFIPQGQFEITETSFMHTTQFEYDSSSSGNGSIGTKIAAPLILNGGHFEQIVVRYGPQNKTQYFIMGGHFRMLRFAPGAHTNMSQSAKVRLCAVNAIGGEYPEFYLSGIYRPDIEPESIAKQGNPHCYTNGGYFGLMAGAGYDKVLGDVTFKIDHSIIDEFYGGGINGSKPIDGSIDVTIDNSLVGKYCGGPKVGPMTAGKTVTTHATGSTFTHYYGGGNGGTSYYRQTIKDGNDWDMPAATAEGWKDFGYKNFNPLNTINGLTKQYQGTDENKGYHGLFEFECFVESNGLGGKPTLRTYINWTQFGTTSTGNTTNVLNRCIIENDFYGGGNLANVEGWAKSTLTDCTIRGNAFGGGYSGKIEPFRIHDKSATKFPYIDKAGLMQNGKGVFDYVKNADGSDRYYTWCYRKSATEFLPKGVVIPSDASTDTNLKSTFEYPAGSDNWYVLTTVSLEGLGAISEYTELTLDGSTTVGTLENGRAKEGTGNVYGGGNESAINGNSTVKLKGNTQILGDVFGGGNEGEVNGSAKVNIMYTEPTP